jgi:hypothetical protein
MKITKTLADKVYTLLLTKEYLRGRANIPRLVSWVHALEMGFSVEEDGKTLANWLKTKSLYEYFYKVNKHELSTYEAVTRVRRLIQAKHEKLRGSDYNQKELLEEKVKKDIDELNKII